jgi:hypothetical protein
VVVLRPGVIGLQLVTFTMHLWAAHLLAAFLAQALVAARSAIVLSGVRLPRPSAAEVAGGKPLGDWHQHGSAKPRDAHRQSARRRVSPRSCARASLPLTTGAEHPQS